MLNQEQQAQIEKLQIRNQELKEALNFAIAVIRNYQMDIRDSKRFGVDLVENGFCQGSAYTGAIPLIKQMARLPLTAREQAALDSEE